MAFAFLYLQRSLKNTYPTIWQMGFAFLLTWQILGKDAHICKLSQCLASPPRVISVAPAHAPARAIPSPAAIFPREALRGYCNSVLAALPSIFINTGIG
jgi:hypothetical protein